jgi:mannose-6-phosphate isomerase-like protein (cupin superfamily)
MPLQERMIIMQNLRMVDQVMLFDDSDGSACVAIAELLDQYPQDEIIFANGGDRTCAEIPEMRMQHASLQFRFGVGGDLKRNSSSWILEEWKAPRTARPWGYYRVLHETSGAKVKELTVDPGAALSMQRHADRSEYWLVSSGEATVMTLNTTKTDIELMTRLSKHQSLHIDRGQWHQLANEDPSPLKVIEIQYGDRCLEDDIERVER